MTKNKRQKVVELLRSGNFTVIYDDNGSGSIYKGKHDYGNCLQKDKVVDFGGQGWGYTPEEVELLIEALGGEVDSV